MRAYWLAGGSLGDAEHQGEVQRAYPTEAADELCGVTGPPGASCR